MIDKKSKLKNNNTSYVLPDDVKEFIDNLPNYLLNYLKRYDVPIENQDWFKYLKLYKSADELIQNSFFINRSICDEKYTFVPLCINTKEYGKELDLKSLITFFTDISLEFGIHISFQDFKYETGKLVKEALYREVFHNEFNKDLKNSRPLQSLEESGKTSLADLRLYRYNDYITNLISNLSNDLCNYDEDLFIFWVEISAVLNRNTTRSSSTLFKMLADKGSGENAMIRAFNIEFIKELGKSQEYHNLLFEFNISKKKLENSIDKFTDVFSKLDITSFINKYDDISRMFNNKFNTEILKLVVVKSDTVDEEVPKNVKSKSVYESYKSITTSQMTPQQISELMQQTLVSVGSETPDTQSGEPDLPGIEQETVNISSGIEASIPGTVIPSSNVDRLLNTYKINLPSYTPGMPQGVSIRFLTGQILNVFPRDLTYIYNIPNFPIGHFIGSIATQYTILLVKVGNLSDENRSRYYNFTRLTAGDLVYIYDHVINDESHFISRYFSQLGLNRGILSNYTFSTYVLDILRQLSEQEESRNDTRTNNTTSF
jgi:hypothetical protein